MLLTQDVRAARVANNAAAGQTDVTTSAVDTREFDTVAFYALLGTVTAGGSGTLKVEQSDESGSGFTALDGASVAYTDADGDDVLIVEVSQPRKRYVRAVIERADQNVQVNGVLALLGQAKAAPVEHDATVAGSELVLAPAEV